MISELRCPAAELSPNRTPIQLPSRLLAFGTVAERVLESFGPERERGITILAGDHYPRPAIRRTGQDQCRRIADFGGEVEHVLNMVFGVLLQVEAAEGPMPPTRFEVKKALLKGRSARPTYRQVTILRLLNDR